MKLIPCGVRGTLAVTGIIAGILPGGVTSFAAAQPVAPSRELRELVGRYTAAWNTHDASILAEFFSADADMIMGNGPILRGRPAIQTAWSAYFAAQEPGRTLTIQIEGIRTVDPDVALLNVRTVTGGRTAEGTELLARRARGTWVLVRQGDDWTITAMRGMPTEHDRIIRSHDQPAH